MFGEAKFSVNEPKENGQVSILKIPVLRAGDPSKVSIVRVHTKDGSATSGDDYHPISEGKIGYIFLKRNCLEMCLLNACLFCIEIVFKEGDTEHYVEVEILYDSFREMREAFTVHLKPDENMVAETKVEI